MTGASIRLTRKGGHTRDRIRSYRIILDDIDIGSIKESRSLDFGAEPGSHVLQLKIDWTRSQQIQFDVGVDEIISFECEPNGGAIATFIDSIRAIGKHGRPYIKLSRVSSAQK